jgi:glycosyltransferase involved in cell wall biosynthesis
MNLFLIKIGKAFNVLKRDGFLNGIKRIISAQKIANKKVAPGDVLIVTNGVGDSAFYRAHNVAEELNENKIRTSVATQDNKKLLRYVSEFKVFVFHRTVKTDLIAKMIDKIKEQKKEIIFETDDLVYDPKFLKLMEGYKKMNFLEKKMYQNGLGGDILNDDYVKTCTTTTNFLAEKLKEKNKKVFIVKNKLSKKDLAWANNILKNQKPKKDQEVIIGYFSGTISHNKDFATIINPLTNILEKYQQVKLFIAGPLDLEDEFTRKFKDRIINSAYVPRKEHFKNIASVDINIAPLEINNPFCESKSELKFFEAGILKVPTIATATQTFRETIIDGEDGFIAKNEKEWESKLKELIKNENLRKKMGEKARQKTLKNYVIKKFEKDGYHDYLTKIIKE